MANYISKTTSNRPAVSNPDALEDVLDEWAFHPMGSTVEANVTDQDELVVLGETDFLPVPTANVDSNTELMDAEPAIDDFLKAVAPFLEEPLIVQTIGSTKLRYPFDGTQCIATPDGRISVKGFYDHQQSFLRSTDDSDNDSAESADRPINFAHIAESFETAMRSHSEIPDDAVDDIVSMVEEACATNEEALAWEHDYDELINRLDPLLDHLSNNGYTEKVSHIDAVQERLDVPE